MTKRQNKLRVLFIGDTGGDSTSLYYVTNLLQMGHRVYPIDPRHFEPLSLRNRFFFGALKRPLPSRIAATSQAILSACRQNRFDLIFVMGENFIPGEVLAEVRAITRNEAPLIYHSHDNNFSDGVLRPNYFENAMHMFDYVFTTKSQNVERYRQWGIENSFFIPSAYEPSVHRPIPPSQSFFPKTVFPVSFIGRFDNSRTKFVDAIGWEPLHVWGGNWKRYPHYEAIKARVNPPIYCDLYADVLSRSLCSLGLLREEVNDIHTQRTFELPACGTLQFAPRNEEIASFFTEDKEVILFDSPTELKEKIEFYLRNEKVRSRIAQAGYDRCTKDKNSYADRMTTILKTTFKSSFKSSVSLLRVGSAR